MKNNSSTLLADYEGFEARIIYQRRAKMLFLVKIAAVQLHISKEKFKDVFLIISHISELFFKHFAYSAIKKSRKRAKYTKIGQHNSIH